MSLRVEDQLNITQEEIGPALQSYLATLARHPFVLQCCVDRHQVEAQLALLWPPELKAAPETQELLNHLNMLVQSIAALSVTHDVVLHIAAADFRLSPLFLPQPNEAAVVASFDAREGVVRSCIMKAMQYLPPLDCLAISSGLLMIAQPLGHVTDPLIDYRDELSIEQSQNLFSERYLDKQREHHDRAFTPSLKINADRETYKKMRFYTEELDMIRRNEDQQQADFERAEAEADRRMEEGDPKLSRLKFHYHLYRLLGLTAAKAAEQTKATYGAEIQTEKPGERKGLLRSLFRLQRPDEYREG